MNTDDAATLAIGYELEAVIARTEHSLVFVAQQRRGARRVAIKVARDSAGTDALRREIQLLRGLRHPHIVTVIDAVATGEPWLVMPLATASLEDAIARDRSFAAAEVVGVVVSIASALDAVHRQRLVHGDVKPANILFDGDGRPWLADFGAAHPVGQSPTTFTPTYFVDDGVEGDVAALARSALAMLGDREEHDAQTLRTVLQEFADVGDRPQTLADAVTSIVAEPRWPDMGPPRPATTTATGPPTHPFGPRPPQPAAPPVLRHRSRAQRMLAVVGAAVIAVGVAHVWREHATAPPTPSPTAVHTDR